jgi:hypothetical protein
MLNCQLFFSGEGPFARMDTRNAASESCVGIEVLQAINLDVSDVCLANFISKNEINAYSTHKE